MAHGTIDQTKCPNCGYCINTLRQDVEKKKTSIMRLQSELAEARATIRLMTKAQKLVKAAGLVPENKRLREAIDEKLKEE